MNQITGDETTRCGKRYMVRMDSDITDIYRCSTCQEELDESTLTLHDGYRGSIHAHDGAGSLGLSSHHYYLVCERCQDCACSVCSIGISKKALGELFSEASQLRRGFKHQSPELISAYASMLRDGGYITRDAEDEDNIAYDIEQTIYDDVLVPTAAGWTWQHIKRAIDMTSDELDSAISFVIGEQVNWDRDITWPI